MVRVTSLCTDCVQVMTNPLCPKCFAKHINYWLRDKNLSQKEVAEITTAMASIISEAEESPADTSCIVCGEKRLISVPIVLQTRPEESYKGTLEIKRY